MIKTEELANIPLIEMENPPKKNRTVCIPFPGDSCRSQPLILAMFAHNKESERAGWFKWDVRLLPGVDQQSTTIPVLELAGLFFVAGPWHIVLSMLDAIKWTKTRLKLDHLLYSTSSDLCSSTMITRAYHRRVGTLSPPGHILNFCQVTREGCSWLRLSWCRLGYLELSPSLLVLPKLSLKLWTVLQLG